MQFRTIIRTVRHHYRQVQERCGVSGAQLWALAAVEAGKGIKVNDVARHLAIHQSTASNLLDKLEEMRMVERRRSDDDRRVVRVHITTLGRALLRRAPKPAQGVLPGALQALSAHEVRALRAHLDSLIRCMHTRVTSSGMTPMAELLSDSAPKGGRRHGGS
jgi:DNA-binding MarR family transcriptional regulator